MGRRLTVGRDRQKPRGLRRRVRALQAWAERFAGFFPAPELNGFGQLNWYARPPIAQRLVCGPRATARFRREVALAMVAAVQHLRRARPESPVLPRVVALLPVDDLFMASLDVFWGDDVVRDFFDRRGPYQDWVPLPAGRSLNREWALATDLPERGFATTERWDEGGEVHSGELWAIGDVEILEPTSSR